MTFNNIFDNGRGRAKSAEDSAKKVHEKIPGDRPEREGVDPELYDGIPDVPRDPKIIRETSPEALSIMSNFITPMFQSTQTAADEQKNASNNPASTSSMASSAKDETAKNMKAEIKDEDRPKVDDPNLEKTRKENEKAVKEVRRNPDGSVIW